MCARYSSNDDVDEKFAGYVDTGEEVFEEDGDEEEEEAEDAVDAETEDKPRKKRSMSTNTMMITIGDAPKHGTKEDLVRMMFKNTKRAADGAKGLTMNDSNAGVSGVQVNELLSTLQDAAGPTPAKLSMNTSRGKRGKMMGATMSSSMPSFGLDSLVAMSDYHPMPNSNLNAGQDAPDIPLPDMEQPSMLDDYGGGDDNKPSRSNEVTPKKLFAAGKVVAPDTVSYKGLQGEALLTLLTPKTAFSSPMLGNATPYSPPAGALTKGALPSSVARQLLPDETSTAAVNTNIMEMYWIDAVEDSFSRESSGTVYLFGKSEVNDARKYVSCSIAVKNIRRLLYVLPKQNEDGSRVSGDDVMKELKEVMTKDLKVKPEDLVMTVRV